MYLYRRFDGVTWYVQAVLNRIWPHGSGLESTEQIDITVSELVDESGLFYHDLLRSQTVTEQSLLKAIGREGVVGAVSAGDFIRRHNLPAASTIRSAAANLKDRDLLYRTGDGFIVYDRFFGLWLAKL